MNNIPLVQNNDVNTVNASLISIKRGMEQFNTELSKLKTNIETLTKTVDSLEGRISTLEQ